MKKAINLAEITEEGLLLVREKDIWGLPGGKPKQGESDYICLFRELNEELSVDIDAVKIFNYYGRFIDKTILSENDLEAEVYFGALKGRLKPSSEICEVKHIRDFENYKISNMTQKIINSLKKDKYL